MARRKAAERGLSAEFPLKDGHSGSGTSGGRTTFAAMFQRRGAGHGRHAHAAGRSDGQQPTNEVHCVGGRRRRRRACIRTRRQRWFPRDSHSAGPSARLRQALAPRPRKPPARHYARRGAIESAGALRPAPGRRLNCTPCWPRARPQPVRDARHHMVILQQQ
jgi:hypothetical protein